MATPGYQFAKVLQQYCDLPVLWRVARLAGLWRIGKLKKIQEQHHSFEAEAVRRMARDLKVKAQAKVAKREAKFQRRLTLYVEPESA
jgi:hypothetical protein